jgi:hypothetical protein
MNKTRWLILLLGLVGCWSAASAQDVVLVANKGVQIYGRENQVCGRLPCRASDFERWSGARSLPDQTPWRKPR